MEKENKISSGKKGLSISSMVLGIISVVLCKSVIISVPCAILAIVFGVNENKKHKNGFAKTGLILGIISIIFTIVLFIISMSITSSLFDTAKEASENYKQTEQKIENRTEWPDGYVNVDGTYKNIYDYINTVD